MRLLQLETRTYVGKDYNEFLKSQEESEEEGNEWKKLVSGDNKVPAQYPCKVLVDPDRIIMAMESFSLEEMTNNPEDPTVDTVLLCLEDGTTLSLICSMDEFSAKLEEFNSRA